MDLIRGTMKKTKRKGTTPMEVYKFVELFENLDDDVKNLISVILEVTESQTELPGESV